MKSIKLSENARLQTALMQKVTSGEAFARSPISLSIDASLMLKPDIDQKMELVAKKIAQAREKRVAQEQNQ